MKTVAVIGFEPYNEMMYPHTYDVLKLIESKYRLIYLGENDRGFSLYQLGARKTGPLSFLPWLRRYRKVVQQYHSTRLKVKKIMAASPDIVIVIDHVALHYAAKYLAKKTKLIFWSHDMYTPDHPWSCSPLIRKLMIDNRKDIQKAHCILIQDGNRAAVLDSILMSHHLPRCYLPVSVYADEFSKRETKKRCSGSLRPSITLMQLGSINIYRSSDMILKAFQNIPPSVNLVFKGMVDHSIVALAENCPRKPEILSRSESFIDMRKAVSAADIGIISCGPKILINRFLSKSSGQLVEFSRLGIPVIVIDMEEVGAFVERNGFGISIKNADSLLIAVEEIWRDYHTYTQSIAVAYDRYYDLKLYEDVLFQAIER